MEYTLGAADGGLRMIWVPAGEVSVSRNDGCGGSWSSLVWRRELDLCRVKFRDAERRGRARKSVVRVFIAYGSGGCGMR